jgi:hypothetical protein
MPVAIIGTNKIAPIGSPTIAINDPIIPMMMLNIYHIVVIVLVDD